MAMSGGVDSSVAASLLVRAGHQVVGLFMHHGQADALACSPPTTAVAARPTRPTPDAWPIGWGFPSTP